VSLVTLEVEVRVLNVLSPALKSHLFRHVLNLRLAHTNT